jgi:predicted transglutaminase-like cysteine proteinase
MKRCGVVVLFACCLAAMVLPVAAETRTSSYPGNRPGLFMKVFGPAQPPHGFVRFCDSEPAHCQAAALAQERFFASPVRLSELDTVNRSVNAAITPLTDEELYGVAEFWTIPTVAGDCEDYALLKRKLLMEKGWPASALLVTVVRDEAGDGHAVLTARTAQGDFVLDNKLPEVKLWHATPYDFVMRQSYVNPRVWVSLEERLVDSPLVMAGAPPKHD